MAKFVELNEAAQMLGLNPDQLVEMRSNGDIHGYRDGASWKFKEEEIARVKEELAGGGAADSELSFEPDSSLDLDTMEEPADEPAEPSDSESPNRDRGVLLRRRRRCPAGSCTGSFV